MSGAERMKQCAAHPWVSLWALGEKGSSSSDCLLGTPSVCRQGASPGTPEWEGPSATPGGSCEQVQPDTYPSPTTTHLIACMVSKAWGLVVVTAQRPSVSAGSRRVESWGGVLSGEQQQRDGRQEEAEGELTQAAAPTAVCRRRSVRSGRTARGRGGPQVLGWPWCRCPEAPAGDWGTFGAGDILPRAGPELFSKNLRLPRVVFTSVLSNKHLMSTYCVPGTGASTGESRV